MCNNRRQQGLTLIELIMFMVIVGAAAAGLLQIMNMANTNSTDPIRRKQALLIAEAYMEEVQQAQMTACDPADDNAAIAITSAQCANSATAENWGPEAGNARPFDNVNDYAPLNYVEGTAVRAFAVSDGVNLIDRDVAGNPLGANAAGGLLANGSMAGITTTLALTRVALGPAGAQVPAADVLQITITVIYGPGANDVITLQGYRSRYEPRAL